MIEPEDCCTWCMRLCDSARDFMADSDNFFTYWDYDDSDPSNGVWDWQVDLVDQAFSKFGDSFSIWFPGE